MKSITTALAALALGTTLALAVDEKPATKAADASPTAAPKAADAAAKTDKPKVDPAERFKKLDTNADGKISADEWKASPNYKKDAAKADEFFGKKDKDGDKSLSLEEFSTGGKKNK